MRSIRAFAGDSAYSRKAAVTARGKIRVCVVAPSLDIYGGQARQAICFLKALEAENEVQAEFLPQNPRLPRSLRALQRIKYLRTFVTTVHYTLLLFARLRGYDVIHVYCASYWSYLLSAMPPLAVAKLYGKKVILHYHSGEAEDHLTRWPKTTVPVMKKFDDIVVCSDYLKDVFAKFGLHSRSILNIVEIERFRYRDRAPLQPRFMCSRLLEPLYNVGNVIRAFHIIQQHVPHATLTIAADGWQRPQLEALVRELHLQHTRFLGFVPFDQMPDLYDSNDIYLIGNDIDNMPAAVTESCASGILLVTTNAGGIPYLVEHEKSALIVSTGDYAGLAREALRLLADSELARGMARNARSRAEEFTWPRVREKWLDLYKTLADKSTCERYVES
jgi:L-malate glycosyltransferase